MIYPRSLAVLLLASFFVFVSPVEAQTQQAIQSALTAAFQIAKTNDTKTDITEAGSVLVLQRDYLVMSETSLPAPGNVYKNGKLGPEGVFAFTQILTSAPQYGQTRFFQRGGKFFVVGIETRKDAVSLTLMSDILPVAGEEDQRFYCSLKFPFPKGTVPSADDVLTQVSQVLKIDDSVPEAAAQPEPEPAPAAAPPTISVGMSRDEVIAAFGVPSKIVRLNGKEIDVFPDMKVTFINGKVADVQ